MDKPVILVVDDDQEVRAVAVTMLADAGYETLAASSAFEAIRLFGDRDVDLLFTDVAMPGLSGLALARRATLLQPKLRVLFTTGLIPAEGWDEQRYGKVVRKPYRERTLVEAVATALASAPPASA
jgi:CheY-like chemotaxis protein